MVQEEEKEILLKDLCARLPYGVKCEVYNCIGVLDEVTTFYGVGVTYSNGQDTTCRIDECKPYLFPLSSMTDIQKRELSNILNCTICFTDYEINIPDYNDSNMGNWQKIFKWCYKNHFDVNDLIPMGLAIDATNLNIY